MKLVDDKESRYESIEGEVFFVLYNIYKRKDTVFYKLNEDKNPKGACCIDMVNEMYIDDLIIFQTCHNTKKSIEMYIGINREEEDVYSCGETYSSFRPIRFCPWCGAKIVLKSYKTFIEKRECIEEVVKRCKVSYDEIV